MSWLLYGEETWLVALLKGVPLFIYVYFLITYVPNYVYYLMTQYLFKFSDDVGFLDRQRGRRRQPHRAHHLRPLDAGRSRPTPASPGA